MDELLEALVVLQLMHGEADYRLHKQESGEDYFVC